MRTTETQLDTRKKLRANKVNYSLVELLNDDCEPAYDGGFHIKRPTAAAKRSRPERFPLFTFA